VTLDAMKQDIRTISISLALVFSPCLASANDWVEVAGGIWSVDSKTLTPIQQSIESYVAAAAARQNRELRPWHSYTFQYRGYAEGYRRYIRVAALCAVVGEANLSAEFYEVFDGDTCYFGVVYDATKSRFTHLRFNNPG
jgi:hypothetical protein